jgi:hypothetical protein
MPTNFPTRAFEGERFGDAPLSFRLAMLLTLVFCVSVWSVAVYGMLKAVGAF